MTEIKLYGTENWSTYWYLFNGTPEVTECVCSLFMMMCKAARLQCNVVFFFFFVLYVQKLLEAWKPVGFY